MAPKRKRAPSGRGARKPAKRGKALPARSGRAPAAPKFKIKAGSPTEKIRKAQFAARLKAVRAYLTGFDAKAYDRLREVHPRTEAGKSKRARELARINRAYKRLEPYLKRSHQRVVLKSEKQRSQLRDYVGMQRLKGLRAVPVPTARPGKVKVKFDKQGQMAVESGREFKEVIYNFPKRPRSHRTSDGRFITRGEHMVQMLEAMLPKMKSGIYVVATRHHYLIPFSAERDALVSTLKRFLFAYEQDQTFIDLVTGFKWMAHTYQTAERRKKAMLEARGIAKLERKQARAAVRARALGKKSKRARLSRRARLTGRM